MQTYISILRGINVSGQKKILMSDLKGLYESLKFKNVITYIQSGNVIFSANDKSSDTELSKKIEKAIIKKYDFSVPVIIRSIEEIERVLNNNPFLKQQNIDTERLYVTFLSAIPENDHLLKLKDIDFSPDKFIIKEKEIFLFVPNGYGETKINNNFFENKLKVTATTRNWKTVNKLAEIANNN